MNKYEIDVYTRVCDECGQPFEADYRDDQVKGRSPWKQFIGPRCYRHQGAEALACCPEDVQE